MDSEKLPKTKENFTLDVEVSQFIRGYSSEYKSASDFVNSIILAEIARQKDLDKEYIEACNQLVKLENKVRSITEQWYKQIEEGNKKEREEAEKKLKEEKERLEREKSLYEKKLDRLNELGLLDAAKACVTMDDFMSLAKRILQITVEQKRPISDSVGAYNMFQMKQWGILR